MQLTLLIVMIILMEVDVVLITLAVRTGVELGVLEVDVAKDTEIPSIILVVVLQIPQAHECFTKFVRNQAMLL